MTVARCYNGTFATVEHREAERAIDAVPVATVPQTIVESFHSPSGWAAIGGRTKRTPQTNDILDHQSNHAFETLPLVMATSLALPCTQTRVNCPAAGLGDPTTRELP
jgi:hypothetical protein